MRDNMKYWVYMLYDIFCCRYKKKFHFILEDHQTVFAFHQSLIENCLLWSATLDKTTLSEKCTQVLLAHKAASPIQYNIIKI